MDTLGKKISIYRHMRQWTQERLAYEVNITQSTLSDIENDKSSPTWKLIMDIARSLDIPILHLLPQEMLNTQGQEIELKNELNQLQGCAGSQFDPLIELIQTKDELIRAKDELIRELRGKNTQKKIPTSSSKPRNGTSVELP